MQSVPVQASGFRMARDMHTPPKPSLTGSTLCKGCGKPLSCLDTSFETFEATVRSKPAVLTLCVISNCMHGWRSSHPPAFPLKACVQCIFSSSSHACKSIPETSTKSTGCTVPAWVDNSAMAVLRALPASVVTGLGGRVFTVMDYPRDVATIDTETLPRFNAARMEAVLLIPCVSFWLSLRVQQFILCIGDRS
jgi:hypothetical protein